MKININEFLLKAILDYWNTPVDEEPVFTEFIQERNEDYKFIQERNEDYIEYLNIIRIDSQYNQEDDICIFDILYNHTIESLDTELTGNNTDIKVKYIVHMYYLLKMSPFPNSKIDKVVFKFYTSIKKYLTVYYNDYDYHSSNKRYLINTSNNRANRHKDDIFDTYNINKGKEYEKEISDLNLIFGKYEKDIIENDKYGEYDSLLMENIYNIVSDFEDNIYEICDKSFIVYLGKNKEESVYADIKVIYMDDPVCEEEFYNGFFIDFKIEVIDKKYIITYIFHPRYNADDKIKTVKRVLIDDDNENYHLNTSKNIEYIYLSTFLLEIYNIEDELSDRESELNYTIV